MLDLSPCQLVQSQTLCLLTALQCGVADSEADRAALAELQQQVAELQSANAELKEEADSSWAELNAKEEVSGVSASLFMQTAACATRECPIVRHTACVTQSCILCSPADRMSARAVTGSHTFCCMSAVAAASHWCTQHAHLVQELDATTARLLQSEDRAARARAQAQQAAAQTRDARAQAAQVSQTLQASLWFRLKT